ncbi:hypothetical protein RB195_015403 [Necator americanus]|uniref:7TM GPCR serpentine receptor class x (Srx) domain-containing protein n=1 Tax=Necator americanus TaxID=51031 RepID=A0ABR1E4V1_NECAM
MGNETVSFQESIFVGITYFLFATILLLIYIVYNLVLLRDYEFRKLQAFRLMIFLGLLDCTQLLGHMSSGFLTIRKDINNNYPYLSQVLGGILNSAWVGLFPLTLIIAINSFSWSYGSNYASAVMSDIEYFVSVTCIGFTLLVYIMIAVAIYKRFLELNIPEYAVPYTTSACVSCVAPAKIVAPAPVVAPAAVVAPAPVMAPVAVVAPTTFVAAAPVMAPTAVVAPAPVMTSALLSYPVNLVTILTHLWSTAVIITLMVMVFRGGLLTFAMD